MHDSGYPDWVRPLPCDSNLSFILPDNYSVVTHKMMQNQAQSVLVPCIQTRFDGKAQLYYMPGSMTPLTALVPALDANTLTEIIRNILQAILFLREKTDLSCCSLCISPELLYADPRTRQVGLICLPTSQKVFESDEDFDAILKDTLLNLLTLSTCPDMTGLWFLRSRLEASRSPAEVLAALHSGSGLSSDRSHGGLRRFTPADPHTPPASDPPSRGGLRRGPKSH